ncbi:MAG: T9SS type A sorting domain-containing protein, partial [Ignavibacteria bacterium]|nr:T9SS type A sorting domain-containing protein [Ignavibacteria bacterium]
WGGKIDGQIRVGGAAYRTGTRPGRILDNGTAASESDPDVRIYRVRRDVPGYAEAAKMLNKVKPEARDEGITTAEVVAQYQADWNEWPASQGAPYEDIDKNGIFDPTKDIPGFVGADQTVWFVNNDLDPGTTDFMYGTLPMGIEQQVTMWGYNKAGDLGNMMFRKYIIINKNAQRKSFTDMYVSMWSDPDNGDASDDFVGCDTTLSLQYVYNAKASDATYGTNPPAAGFDFFQGPRIKTNVAADTAIFKGKKWSGYKNLPMTAAYYFAQGGTPDYQDPQQGASAGAQQFYNLFQGFVSRTGVPFPIPTQYQVPGGPKSTVYPLSGDPVAGTGYLDGAINPPGDRRMGSASGTFTLAYGDTQEVVVAQVCAGARSGISNIRAITLLKAADKEAQKAFNNFFPKPTPFLNPVVEIVNLDRQVVLNWGSDVAAANATENYVDEFYKFQGYEVFQLATEGSSLEDAETVRIATYDIIDGTTSIIGQDIDPVSSDVISKVYHYGKDTGLQRQIILNKNYVTNENLNNGSKYFYAVRAYANTDSSFIETKAITTTLDVLVAVPQTPDPGVRLTSKAGDRINATHSKGSSDGLAFAIVVDPSKVTGKTYKVSFKTDTHGDTYWQLNNGTSVILDKQYNQADNGDYYIVDGLMVKVTGPTQLGVKQSDAYTDEDKKLWGWDIAGTRRFTWAGGDPGGNFGLESFGNTAALGGHGTLGWASPRGWFVDGEMIVGPTELKNTELRLAKVVFTGDFGPTLDVNDVNVSYGYRYMRNANGAAAKPEFAPFIISKLGSYSFQIFEKNVPLSAWNIDDPAAPKRLAVGFLENNVATGLVDGKYWPGSNANITDNGLGTREWLYIFDEAYTTTANDVNTGQLIAAGNKSLAARFMYTAMWNRRGSAPFSDTGTGVDKFYIYPNKPNSAADEFTFTAPTAAFSAELAKADVEKVNVFPNPYYGVNSQEINKYQRFVTFNHLPKLATIRIFNLAGQLVRTIDKNADSQYQRWDLKNFDNLPVASGMYVVQVDMPAEGVKKTLKLIVIQETQVLDKF